MTIVPASLACNFILPARATSTAGRPAASPTTERPTTAPTESLTPTGSPTPEPAPTEAGAAEADFVAYVSDGQRLVTDVTRGVKGGTTQYTEAGANDGVTDLAWSPAGEFIAYTGPVGIEQHSFYVYAIGAGTPVGLGTEKKEIGYDHHRSTQARTSARSHSARSARALARSWGGAL